LITLKVEKTKVRNVDRYLSVLPPRSTFRIISAAGEGSLARAGLEEDATSGVTFLPAIVGRVTGYNAEGRYVTRRDLPKEERYVGSREFTRTEWHGPEGREVTDTVDYYRMCYPRDLVPPPSVELTLVDDAGKLLFVSPELTYVPENSEHNKHTINLMLELFGSCEIVLENLARLSPPATRRVNWVMLPPGEHPWDRIEAHVKAVFKGKAPTVAAAVLMRQDVIVAHRPSAIYTGQAGFSDYFAYIFKDRGLVVLESVFYGNALYVFGQNWEATSMLTKADIIRNDLAAARIIHSRDWIAHLADVMRPMAAE
jgi:hypothetical protein